MPVPHEGSCVGRHVELAGGVDADRDDGSVDVQCRDDERVGAATALGARTLMSARYVTIGAMVVTVVGIVVVVVVVDDGWVRPVLLAASRDGRTSVVAGVVSVGTFDVRGATDVTSAEDVLAAPIAIQHTAMPPMRMATADATVGLVNGQSTNRHDRERYRTEPATTTTANAASRTTVPRLSAGDCSVLPSPVWIRNGAVSRLPT